MHRRLSAILSADMVGYSRLMEINEIDTLQRQKAHRAELIDPTLGEFHGRIVKEMGDGVLVEFPSVVEAVQSAVVIQRAMAEREADLSDELRIRYRMGINLGDIISDGEDIFGDGVNVAARLEQQSEAGGICVSGAAYDSLRANLDVGFEALGELQLKNIERPVRAYRVLIDQTLAGKNIQSAEKVKLGRSRRLLLAGSLLGLLLSAIALSSWWLTRKPDFAPVEPVEMALPLPQGPSIAVLPFGYLGPDPNENGFLAQGMTGNIISALSRLPKATVIAQSTTSTYNDEQVDMREVSRQLGVRYVLDGSVQLSANTIRVTVQLIDAIKGKIVWTRTFDRPLEDVFAVQDEISLLVSQTVYSEAIVGSDVTTGLPARNLQAWSETVEGLGLLDQNTPEALKKARKRFQRALSLDEMYSTPHVGLAFVNFFEARYGLTNDPAATLAEGARHAKNSLELNPNQSFAHTALAYIRMIQRRPEEAVASSRNSVEIAPGAAFAQAGLGWMLLFSGDAKAARPHIERAKRIYAVTPWWLDGIHVSSFMDQGDYESAIPPALSALESAPQPYRADMLVYVALAYYASGDDKEARRYLDEALKLVPEWSIARARFWDLPYSDPAIPERRYELMREMGIPEGPSPQQ